MIESKHIFAGNTRLATKMEKRKGTGAPTDLGLYYYHGDHLGSSNAITNRSGNFHEHVEYFPYGETWVEERVAGGENMPHKFTGKELDPETGLYYYGYRYLDPKLGDWISADPPLAKGDYLPVPAISDEAKEHNSKLPGMGGVFNSINLDAYQYAGRNPIKFVDPDGDAAIMVGIKVESASGGGVVGYEGLAYCTGEKKFYFFKSSSTSLGFRADVGVDVNIITSDTFENYLSSNTITVSGDIKAGGLGLGSVEKNGKLDLLLNLSVGPGLGGSVSSSALPSKTRYTETGKYIKLQILFKKEQFNLLKSYISGDNEDMIKSFSNMVKINNEIKNTIKEK